MEKDMVAEKYQVEVVGADYYLRQIKCQDACPVHTDIPGFIRAITQGKYEEGYIRVRQPNPFVSNCGRVCNAPCETACRRGQIDAPVTTRALKRFVCEKYGVEAMTQLAIVRTSGRRVGTSLLSDSPPCNSRTIDSFGTLVRAAIGSGHRKGKIAVIGAGPAGLTAAHDLGLLGHQVTIFEATSVLGGMLRLGVPEYRLPRNLLGLEIAEILERGVELRLNARLGERFTINSLREEGYEAIFLALGLYRSRDLNIEGVDLDGVLCAIEFLLNINMGYKVELGQKVVVLGGGAVAVDVARTVTRARETEPLLRDGELTTALGIAREALRLGAPEVHIVCLESEVEMPAPPEEVEDALAEGAILHPRRGPKRILGVRKKVTGLETIAVASVFDSQGRFNPTFIPDTEFILEGDTIVLAIGQTSDLSSLLPDSGIKVTPRGTIAVDSQTLATTAPGVFAGGDVAFGPRSIIAAVADGHRAARSIDQYLQGSPLQVRRRGWMTPVNLEEIDSFGRLDIPRKRPPLLPLERRIGIAEVELVYPPEMAQEQALRCLRCNVQTVFNGDLCLLCGGCVDVCPQNCLKLVRLDKIAGDERLKALVQARYGIPWEDFQKGGKVLNQGTAMIKDETRCVRCGLCARRCPTGAITMEAFWFEEELVYEGNTVKEVV